VNAAVGLKVKIEPGALVELRFRKELKVCPSADRLSWLILNAHRLVPRGGKHRRSSWKRVIEHPRRDGVLALLGRGQTEDVPKVLRLEGKTSCDCLVECEKALIWIEGKMNDLLDPSTKWDSSRDQLARNLEAVRLLAMKRAKDYCLVICHEREFKHYEEQLIRGYRNGTWQGGWPHLDDRARREMGDRIGLVTWHRLVETWPGLSELSELRDLHTYRSAEFN